ncbi:hypothetical protein [Aquicoccus sp. SU-CL01552]
MTLSPGDLCFAFVVDRMPQVLTAPSALRRLNLGAGFLLICVGLNLPFA